MTQPAQRTLADNATTQALNIIDSRINALGIAEPTLQTHGAQSHIRFFCKCPVFRIRSELRTSSRVNRDSSWFTLSVHRVPRRPNLSNGSRSNRFTEQRRHGSAESQGFALPGTLEKSAADDPNQQKPKQWVVVEVPAIIDGSELRNASAIPSQGGRADEYEINFSLKKAGADKFGAWTGSHINEYMGVVLNGEVSSIAFIKSQIFDSGQITGRFTKQSAEDLALTLRSGALPAPIEYLEERTVGPSLGQDSIRAGVRASLVGLALVVVFMLFYYRGSGVNAVVALLLNMILMLAGLIVFGATLTLPGIAGIILTIGMAVDSNVLIFERIREELRSGKTVPSAVDLGFDRAFITIIDTHVTTIISSLFLFVFGTGPIRGFAVTLVIGLLINLFSAVYVSRTIFIWLLSRKKVESLSI